MRNLRRRAAAVALAVAATACGGSGDLVDRIGDSASELVEGVASELDTVVPDAGEGEGAPGDAPTSDTGDTGGGADGTGDGSDGAGGGAPPDPGTGDAPAATPADDLGPVGANGRAMLRGDRPTLVVEVDVQQGVAADDAALAHMVDQLAAHADKPGGIRFVGGNTFASDRTAWTTADLRDAAAANRSTSTDGEQVSLYLLYVRGGFHADGEETTAVGVTYRASEIAMFPERWSGLSGLLGGDRAVERAVLVHELGHALGLVNLTYDSEIDHEDPEHPGHSDRRGSVMFWAVETTLIGQVFSGPPPDTFDDADAADLEGLRTGRY